MLQVLSICTRVWFIALIACLLAYSMTGWVTAGHVDSTSARRL